MPNWCHNNLSVQGLEEDVIAFVNKARTSSGEEDQPLFFSNFLPEPLYEEKDGWWLWRIQNWGTKWEPNFDKPLVAFGTSDADPGAIKEQLDIQTTADREMTVAYEFDTAWAPPLPVIEAASKQHPDLEIAITWGEPGGDFGGRARFVGGVQLEIEEGQAEDFLPPEKMWF